jgi:transposase
MLQITPQMRVLVAVEPADFRKGIDGIARLCRKVLNEDPLSGAIFVFCNRRKTAIKALVYDGRGFWLAHRRLSKGQFSNWPMSKESAIDFEAHELQVLLCGGDPKATKVVPQWRSVRAQASF